MRGRNDWLNQDERMDWLDQDQRKDLLNQDQRKDRLNQDEKSRLGLSSFSSWCSTHKQ